MFWLINFAMDNGNVIGHCPSLGKLQAHFWLLLVIHTCRYARCGYIVYCFCLFVRLWISPPRIKLAASNFARWFISVHGRESHILVNFAPPQALNWPANPVSSDDVAKRCVYVLLSHNGAPLRECINKHRNVFIFPSSPDGGTGDKV